MAAVAPWVLLDRVIRVALPPGVVGAGEEAGFAAAGSAAGQAAGVNLPDFSFTFAPPPRATLATAGYGAHPNSLNPDRLPCIIAAASDCILAHFGDFPLNSNESNLVLMRFFLADGGGVTKATAEPIPDRHGFPDLENVGNVGLYSDDHGRFKIAELQVRNGLEQARLVCLPANLDGPLEWEVTNLPHPVPHVDRDWAPHGAVTLNTTLWWYDLSWGMMSCDISDDADPNLTFHSLPDGRVLAAATPDIHARRCITVSRQKVRYTEIITDGGGAPTLCMWTRKIGGEGWAWRGKHAMSFEVLWDDDSYVQTGLPRNVPVLVAVCPSDPNLVYFALEHHTFGVNVRELIVLDDVSCVLVPPSSRCIAWNLPLHVAIVGECLHAREEATEEEAAACHHQQRPWQELPDDILGEVLVRVPPDPVTLFRAAAVCRGWCRIFSDAGFHGRFAGHHRLPPLIGFLANVQCGSKFYSRFIPTTNRYFPRRVELHQRHALDARNGRVLLTSTIRNETPVLEVWNPITDDFRELPRFPQDLSLEQWFDWNAAILCAKHSYGECNIKCRGEAFRVVLLDSESEKLRIHIYRSEHDVWRDPDYGPPSPLLGLEKSPPALTASGLYFAVYGQNSLVRYDLDAHGMTLVPFPEVNIGSSGVLTTSKDGGLGVAKIVGNEVLLWSYVETRGGGDVWQRMGYIDLNKILSDDCFPISGQYIGFAHGLGIFFIGALNGRCTFVIHNPEEVRCEQCGDGITNGVVPYTSFYFPVHSSASSWRREDVIGREIWESLMRAMEDGNMVIDEEKEDLEALTAQTVEELKSALSTQGKGAQKKKIEVLRALRRLLSQFEAAIKAATKAGAVPLLVQYLSCGSPDEQLIEAAWCLTNIAAGEPKETKSLLPALPLLIAHLGEKSPTLVAEQCAIAIGNVAKGADLRSKLLAQGALQPLARLMVSNKGSTVGTAAWALSNLIKGPDSKAADELISTDGVLNAIIRNLEKADEELATEVAWLVVFLSTVSEKATSLIVRSSVPQSLIGRLVESENSDFLIPVLRSLGHLIAADGYKVDPAVTVGNSITDQALSSLIKCLKSGNIVLKKEASWAMSNIAALHLEHKKLIFASEAMPLLMRLLKTSSLFDIQREAARTLLNLCVVPAGNAAPPDIVVDHLVAIVNGGALPKFIYLVRFCGIESAKLGLQFLELVMRGYPNGKGPQLVEREGGIKAMERFQFHKDDELMRNMVNRLVDMYFGQD